MALRLQRRIRGAANGRRALIDDPGLGCLCSAPLEDSAQVDESSPPKVLAPAIHGQTGVMEVVNGEVSTQVTLGLSRRSNREGDYL